MNKNILDKNNPNYKYYVPKRYLLKEYKKKKKSIVQISVEFGCSAGTIRRNLKKYKIKTRTRSLACKLGGTGKYNRTEKHREIQRVGTLKRFRNDPEEREKYRIRFTGKNNPNWKHGKYFNKHYCKRNTICC